MIHVAVWIIVAGIAGLVASKVMNRSGSGLFADMALGFIGGCAGGFFVYRFALRERLGGHLGLTGAAIEVMVAITGAMLVIWLYERAVAIGETPRTDAGLAPAASPSARSIRRPPPHSRAPDRTFEGA